MLYDVVPKFVHFRVANNGLQNTFRAKLFKQETSKTKFVVKNVNFVANSIVASLDVGSLFTNITLDETTKSFSKDGKTHHDINEDLKEFLQSSSFESLFIFANSYYCQLDSMAMRHTLANTFLLSFRKVRISFSDWKIFILIFAKRHVDYAFVDFNSHEQLKRFVEYMNTKYLHNNLFCSCMSNMS